MLVTTGCGTVSLRRNAVLDFEVPPSWSQTSSEQAGMSADLAAQRLQWWRRFDEPLLVDLVGQALRANTSVRSAQAALRQARALRDLAAAGLLPALGSSASAQHSASGDGSSGETFRAGLDAAWEADVFGVNRRAVDASQANAQASSATLAHVRTTVAAEVALNLIALRGVQSRLLIADDNQASQQETLQITQWREQAGLVTALEVEQARGAVEQTLAQSAALRTSIEQTQHALAVLTGQPPAALATLLAATAPVPQALDDPQAGIPAETLRQRGDVAAAEIQVSAAWARYAQAKAAREPNFKLGGSLGVVAMKLGALTNGASIVSALVASMSWPVFDGGAGRAQVKVQQAALDQATLAYQSAVLTALKEVEDALTALRGDRQRLAHLQNAANASANAALMARQRYSSGLVDFQVVLETQRSQLGSQDSVASARADLGADQVRLYQALGGGWQSAGNDEAKPLTPAQAPADKAQPRVQPS
jgi:NodT family efflux transporter outer membrane factor (OMF) lipoprotein